MRPTALHWPSTRRPYALTGRGPARLLEVERELQARTNGGRVLHHVASIAPWHLAPEMRALQTPIDPTGADAMRPLAVPAPVAVREGPEGEPAAVRWGERWRRVSRIVSDSRAPKLDARLVRFGLVSYVHVAGCRRLPLPAAGTRGHRLCARPPER